MIWPTVAATGHRPQHLAPDVRGWVRSELARIAVKLRDECSMACGISGMALGTDLWWADAVVEAGVKLWAHVPYPQQPDPWKKRDGSNPDRVEWQRLLDLAANTTLYGQAYDVDLLGKRNVGMLAVSNAVVTVWRPGKRSGGTYGALCEAVERNMPVVWVDPVHQRTLVPPRAGLAELLGVRLRRRAA